LLWEIFTSAFLSCPDVLLQIHARTQQTVSTCTHSAYTNTVNISAVTTASILVVRRWIFLRENERWL